MAATQQRAFYWEPHTSSIDFCETNYLLFDTIAEWHNAWSSLLGLSLLGAIGILYNNPLKEFRDVVAYSILIAIGLGSIGLHTTLHWIFQASDELPMLYLSNCLNFMGLEFDAPPGKSIYPWLPYAFTGLSVVHTIFYYRFRHHYIVFFFTYASGVVLHIFLGYRVMVLKSNRRGPISKSLALIATVSYLGIGVPVWMLDMFHCSKILRITESSFLPGLWKGITPHVLWHFAAGFGTYCAIACVTACRLEELEIPFRLQHVVGVVPIIVPMENSGATKTSSKVE